MPELAEFAGFSRSHLSRLFYASFGEAPSEFIRRIRMERAAYHLCHANSPIVDVAYESGLSGPEAFCRAFRSVYGMSPTDFKRSDKSWQLPAPSNFHWTPDPVSMGFSLSTTGDYEVAIIRRRPMQIAALRVLGDYSLIGEGFRRLEALFPHRPWEAQGCEVMAVYHDNSMTMSDLSRARADIGFTMPAGLILPKCMHVLSIPGGAYACTKQYSDVSNRNSCWQYMNKTWIPTSGQRPINVPAMDVYRSWPLPWPKSLAKILVGLELDLGHP